MKVKCPKCNNLFYLIPIREKLLKILEKPTTVSELKEMTGCDSFGTLAYHLKNLLNEGIIKKYKEKNINFKGKRTYYLKNNKK